MHELGGEWMQSFDVLSNSRQYGMGGALPISIESMAAYCSLFEISTLDEREQFIRVIQRLDHAFLALTAEKTDTKTNSEVAAPLH